MDCSQSQRHTTLQQQKNMSSSKNIIALKKLRSKYRKACFLLKKVEINKKSGKKDEVISRKIIEEYELLLNVKRASEKPNSSDKSNIEYIRNTSLKPSTNNTGILNNLTMALVDNDFSNNHRVTDLWPEIEAKLSQMIMDYVQSKAQLDMPVPRYESSTLISGCRIIHCMDEFSKKLLIEFVAKIQTSWDGLHLRLVLAKNIPQSAYARIWLPKTATLQPQILLECLKLQNPTIPIDRWQVVRCETSNKKSNIYLLLITEDSVEPLKLLDNKLSFGVRKAKLEIYPNTKPIEDEDVECARNLMDEINLTDD